MHGFRARLEGSTALRTDTHMHARTHAETNKQRNMRVNMLVHLHKYGESGAGFWVEGLRFRKVPSRYRKQKYCRPRIDNSPLCSTVRSHPFASVHRARDGDGVFTLNFHDKRSNLSKTQSGFIANKVRVGDLSPYWWRGGSGGERRVGDTWLWHEPLGSRPA